MGDLIFEKYQIQSRLAVGGMGEVFYALQTQRGVKGFERPVILKSLLPDLAQQEGFIDQFLDEARVAATLNHPNVVSIYEVGLWNGVYFIAMEYIRGRNIAQLMKSSLKQKLPVPPTVIARIIHDAALGLDHAHHATDGTGAPLNVVHRDVSPQNIMVRDDGVTKVVDFGIARASNRSTRTATGAVKGKLAYMAPEQLLSRPLSGATDQFALGIVLWEMCAGRRLFTSERDLDLIQKVLEDPIPNPVTLVAGLPEDLGEIALKMVERDPERRYASCAEAARELSGFLMKHSPPSSESPVAGYMKQLGTEDLKTANRATPSNANFVISLGKSGGTPGGPVVPETDEEVLLGSMVMTTPEPIQALHERRKRRNIVGALLGFFLLGGLGAGGFIVASRPQPAAPPGVVAVDTPPPPSVPVEEKKGDLPTGVGSPTPPAAAAQGKLALSTVPSGALVRFDGRPFTTPVTLEGAAGPHFLMVEKPGFKRLELEVSLEDGKEVGRELKLEKLAGRPPPAPLVPSPAPPVVAQAGPGYLSLDTTPWTKVSIGDEALGSTPLFRRKLPAGKHTLTLVNEGENIRTTRAVEVKPGETVKVSFSLK